MAEKLKIGKLWKRHFFEDLGDSGNFFRITPIFRDVKDETEAGLNIRIDRANRILRGERDSISPDYMCTLMLTPQQLDGISDDWKSKWAGKTILMVHDWEAKIEEVAQMDVRFWREQGTDLFLWSSPDKVYYRADGNKLNFRYPVVAKAIVHKYEEPEKPMPTPDSQPVPNPLPVSGKWKVIGTVVDGAVDLLIEQV